MDTLVAVFQDTPALIARQVCKDSSFKTQKMNTEAPTLSVVVNKKVLCLLVGQFIPGALPFIYRSRPVIYRVVQLSLPPYYSHSLPLLLSISLPSLLLNI